jgi:flagellar protein FlaG
MDVIGISQGRQNSIDYNLNQKVSNGENVKKLNDNQNAEVNFSEEDIKKSVEKLNTFLEDEKVHAVYERHEKLNQIMIKIVDDNTKEVIAEYPPKKILDMVAKMCEMVGILIDKKA